MHRLILGLQLGKVVDGVLCLRELDVRWVVESRCDVGKSMIPDPTTAPGCVIRGLDCRELRIGVEPGIGK